MATVTTDVQKPLAGMWRELENFGFYAGFVGNGSRWFFYDYITGIDLKPNLS